MGRPELGVVGVTDGRATKHCYWCGGETADGGSIRIQMNEGEPKRETCPDCFRDWPPEEVDADA